MSPWLHKKFSGKTLFFSELLIVSTVIHCLIGLALFVLYRGQYESFSFEVHSKFNPDQPVLFLHHRGAMRSVCAAGHHKGRARSTKAAAVSKGGAKSVKHASVAQPSKAISKKTATMFLDKTKKPKIVAHKKNKKQKKQQLKVAAAKNISAAPAAAVQPEPQQEVVEKLVQKEEIVAPKMAVHEGAPENPVQEAHNENAAAAPESAVPESFDIAIGAEGVGDGHGEEYESGGLPPEVARIYYAVQEEVTTRWKPPMNLPKDLVCTIAVRLNREGAIADVTVKKSSGVLIYDLAASEAAQDMKLPQIAWGKEFSIAFKL